MCKKYHPRANEELPLSVGQLVEVLDRSRDSWLVCTIGEEDSEPMEGFVPAKALRKYEPGKGWSKRCIDPRVLRLE